MKTTGDWIILLAACVPIIVFGVWWFIDRIAETLDDPQDFDASAKMHADWEERESKWSSLK